MKTVKNPFRGYRRYMKAYCEICGRDVRYQPSELDAHHIISQSEFKKRGEKVRHGLNIATLCPNHHRQVETGDIVIDRKYMSAPSGYVILYWYKADPDNILAGD